MRYLITGKADESAVDADLPREKLLRVLHSGIVPMLHSLLEHQRDGKILSGGVIPLRTVVLIVELPDSKLTAARRYLMSLPGFELFDWEVTPLETFEELGEFFDPEE